MKTLLFIPARGGSKTIEMKNLSILRNEPLMYWVCRLAREEFPNVASVVSTDNRTIFDYAENTGMSVAMRSPATADGPVHEAVLEYVENHPIKYDAVILLQPTSPFVTRQHVEAVIQALGTGNWASAQTIHKVPHNYHAWNQRLEAQYKGLKETKFIHKTNYERPQRKQDKPAFWAFGNVVGTMIEDISTDLFPNPSVGIEIDRLSSMDIDQPEDISIAEALIKEGLVSL